MRTQCLQKFNSMRLLSLSVAIVALAGAAMAHQQPVPSPTVSYTIMGAVVSGSGEPLRGVSVSLQQDGSNVARSLTTNSEGNFQARDLPNGTFYASATLPGYLNAPRTLCRPGDFITLKLVKGGVVFGTVTTAAGRPLINAGVRVFMVRDINGNSFPARLVGRIRLTDDRGYYRVYGLAGGSYIVSVGGPDDSFRDGNFNLYKHDSATYAPSSTRDGAAEITVQPGQEAMADIQYRAEPGYSVNGKIAGAQSPHAAEVTLSDAKSRTLIMTAYAYDEARTFTLAGVLEGEYEIRATLRDDEGDAAVSPPHHILVKGADVNDVGLALAPLPAISGHIVIESDLKLGCVTGRETAMRAIVVTGRRDPEAEQNGAGNQKPSDNSPTVPDPYAVARDLSQVSPNERGEIRLHNLNPGLFRITARMPGEAWYLRAIALEPTEQKRSGDVVSDGIRLKSGERVAGLTITVTEGAASVRGHVALSEGQRSPPGVRIHLFPAEREAAGDILRFFEAQVSDDGTFGIGNIPPGRYWITTRTVSEATIRPIAFDSAARTQLLRDAENGKHEVSLQPCQRVIDYQLPFTPPLTTEPKPRQ
jgi:hypothetical protein